VRVDDPGSDGFDDFSEADPANFARYDAVSKLYSALCALIQDYGVKKTATGDFDYMRDVMTLRISGAALAAQGLVGKPATMFDTEHWRTLPISATVLINGKRYWYMRMRTRFDSPYWLDYPSG
jgi:hypothetical protein